MTALIWPECARSVAEGVGRLLGAECPLAAVRVPARGADLGVRLPSGADAAQLTARADAALASFLRVRGAVPFSACRTRGGFLLFTVSLPLLDAALAETLAALPPAGEDCGSLALNRMLLLARKGGDGCPDAPAVRHALFLALGIAPDGETPDAQPHFASFAHRLREAERALLAMLLDTPPRQRRALANECGGAADAAARLLYRAYSRAEGAPAKNER